MAGKADQKSQNTAELKQSEILQYLQDETFHYLTPQDNKSVVVDLKAVPQAHSTGIKDSDIILYQIEEITYDDKDRAPRKEALENVLSAVRVPGYNFIYLLVGDQHSVKFYYGLKRTDPDAMPEIKRLNVREVGDSILKASLQGNFRGCKVRELDPTEKNNVLEKVRAQKFVSRIEGVAGSIKDNEEFQGVDRLVDVMRGNSFCVLIVAQSIPPEDITRLEQQLHEAYSELNTYVKVGTQDGFNSGSSSSVTTTDGTTEGTSTSDGTNSSDTNGTSTNTESGTSTTTTQSKSSNTSSSNCTTNSGSEGSNHSKTTGTSTTTGTSSGSSHSVGKQEGTSTGESHNISREHLNKCAQEWVKYCDDVLFPRIDYGRGKGLFMTAFYVMSSGATNQIKLENTALSLYSGKQGNRVPLRAFRISDSTSKNAAAQIDCMKQFQIPVCSVYDTQAQCKARTFLSQNIRPDRTALLSNWISTNELSVIAGLPQREVIGMRLQEQVEFGLNYTVPQNDEQIELGKIVQDGIEVDKSPVYLDKGVLDKHIFIAGVTGSGKTTTCQRILLQSKLPFLVIEPAKTEYRIMKNQPACKNLLVFTLGNDDVAPFRLNPFEFMPKESITSHVDMIKASLEAAFDQEAAEPQIIEAALYRCYENCGWDIASNHNTKYPDPFSDDVQAFPTIRQLLEVVPQIVNEQGFDDRLRDEYTGSIRAMLQSLTLGSKGAMLNTPRSIDIDALLDKQVVLELENIRNGSEKALIMGFIMSALNEAIRERYLKSGTPHHHILLVEEAHRLLSRYTPGDSKNKKQGVETFSDMLAEIRKYGECLMIIDQIPNKMSPEILKNTNTKIIHRIFAQDDKDAVGNTMALNDEQKSFLSHLNAGRAVVFSDGYSEAMLVQITPETSTSDTPLNDRALTRRALQYYREECRRKIFMPLRDMGEQEVPEAVRQFVRQDIPHQIVKLWNSQKTNPAWYRKDYSDLLRETLDSGWATSDDIVNWISLAQHRKESLTDKKRQILKSFFEAYASDEEGAKKQISKLLIRGTI